MIKKYVLYLIRWQLSTPILAVALVFMASYGALWATIAANFIGGLIFFWVDRFIFTQRFPFAIWTIKEKVECEDCGKSCRGYRLVKLNKYDKFNDNKPEFRCELCSTIKSKSLIDSGDIA